MAGRWEDQLAEMRKGLQPFFERSLSVESGSKQEWTVASRWVRSLCSRAGKRVSETIFSERSDDFCWQLAELTYALSGWRVARGK